MSNSYKENYLAFLKKYLMADPDAFCWVCAYGLYVHAIDDIIDGDKTDSEFILKTFEFAPVVYGNIFYLKNFTKLYPLVKMTSNAYMDSVLLEKEIKSRAAEFDGSELAWKKSASDILRQSGNEVILACIEIVNDVETRRKASLELRRISYLTHHDKEGNPV